MAVVKTLIPSGGSQAVVLPKPFLDQLGVTRDRAQVEIALQGDTIVITPHRYATAEEQKASMARVVAKRRGLLKRLANR